MARDAGTGQLALGFDPKVHGTDGDEEWLARTTAVLVLASLVAAAAWALWPRPLIEPAPEAEYRAC